MAIKFHLKHFEQNGGDTADVFKDNKLVLSIKSTEAEKLRQQATQKVVLQTETIVSENTLAKFR